MNQNNDGRQGSNLLGQPTLYVVKKLLAASSTLKQTLKTSDLTSKLMTWALLIVLPPFKVVYALFAQKYVAYRLPKT